MAPRQRKPDAMVLAMKNIGSSRDWAEAIGVSHTFLAETWKEGRVPQKVKFRVRTILKLCVSFWTKSLS